MTFISSHDLLHKLSSLSFPHYIYLFSLFSMRFPHYNLEKNTNLKSSDIARYLQHQFYCQILSQLRSYTFQWTAHNRIQINSYFY